MNPIGKAMKRKTNKINWLNTLFLTITPTVAIIGTISLIYTGHTHWETWTFAGVLAIFCGFSITAGYHRLFSHGAYQAAWLVRLFFMLFGSATFEGSVLEWCTDHRNHHLYTDTDKDPYSAKRGFWYSHITWLFTLDPSKRDFSNVKDLKADPILWFQHKFYIPIAVFVGFVFPVLFAGLLWGDWLGGLIIAGALRVTFSQHTTFFINSICHIFGKQTYSDRNTARDNWVTALFTFGEGYHNFHHKFPLDYRNAIKFYQFDPTKWLINTLAFFRLAKNRKTVSKQKILEYKMIMDKKRLAEQTNRLASLSENTKQTIQTLYDSILQQLSELEKLEKTYKKLKSRKLSQLQMKTDEYKALLKKRHAELKQLKLEVKCLRKAWQSMVRFESRAMPASA